MKMKFKALFYSGKMIGVRLCDCIKIFEEADVRSKKL